MTEPSFLVTPEGRRIAYRLTDGEGPAVVFCGGFKSDMEGTKALHLQAWAERTGRAFLRFDYSGHGQSEGAFLDGSIGDWFEDARAVCGLLAGPLLLVGSSMGGWISLLLAREMARGWRASSASRPRPTSPRTACGAASTRRSARRCNGRGR